MAKIQPQNCIIYQRYLRSLGDTYDFKAMEKYFEKFRKNIYGIDQEFVNAKNEKKRIIYADWTASGRLYKPIEKRLQEDVYPFVANTHTETSITGMGMTYLYDKSKQFIKQHVNASETDVIISSNSGMTGVVNKFQRMLGLRLHENFKKTIQLELDERPIVFVTHMEHHSNQTSWLETIAEVEIIEPNSEGLVDLNHFRELLEKHKSRKTKIAAVTSCSNVTGIITPYYEIAEMIHAEGGLCFVDFACSAPYIDIDMHPEKEGAHLDAIYFSPHKFLGGPGATGILIFTSKLYHNEVPDNPGGGTVEWTNPWGGHRYIDNIEVREDGGTPPFLQTIKAAMCMKLKEEMGVQNILKREKQLINILWDGLSAIPNLRILAENHKKRLGVISFYIEGLHYNLAVKMLNDRYGIQTRGGCSCAGTYGHYLLNIAPQSSERITKMIDSGDQSERPGWIRLSIHPTMRNEEATFIVNCLTELAAKYSEWVSDYEIDACHNIIRNKQAPSISFIKDKMDACLQKELTE